jgi:hypothetical protein
MSYTYYCLGLAAYDVNLTSLLDDNLVTAYAIGSLDRLNNVRLPRCRKEVEDAVAALSDPNYVTLNQQWQERCDRLQAERDDYHSQLDALRRATATSVDGDAFMQVKKEYIEAFGSDNYGMLREHMDAHTRRGDGSPDSDLATLLLFTTMKYHFANKAK